MNAEQLSERVGAIVDSLDEAWQLVADLIAEMRGAQVLEDASADLDLHELASMLASSSSVLWRKRLPEVIATHFPEVKA